MLPLPRSPFQIAAHSSLTYPGAMLRIVLSLFLLLPLAAHAQTVRIAEQFGIGYLPLFVMREILARDGIRQFAIAGYSLGGNLTLKLAGDLGDEAPPDESEEHRLTPVTLESRMPSSA